MRYISPMFGLFSKKKKPAKKAAKAKSAPEKKSARPTEAVAAKLPKGEEKSSLKAAISAMEQTEQRPAANKTPISAKAQLDRAKTALERRAGVPVDRQKLIEQALAIQQTQSKLLDQLPAETRDRLRTLAIKTFVIDPAQQDKKKLN